MIELSQNDLEAIAAYPLGDGLDTFRSTFISTHFKDKTVDIVKVIDDMTSDESYASEL